MKEIKGKNSEQIISKNGKENEKYNQYKKPFPDC